jgi:hypothetical protein
MTFAKERRDSCLSKDSTSDSMACRPADVSSARRVLVCALGWSESDASGNSGMPSSGFMPIVRHGSFGFGLSVAVDRDAVQPDTSVVRACVCLERLVARPDAHATVQSSMCWAACHSARVLFRHMHRSAECSHVASEGHSFALVEYTRGGMPADSRLYRLGLESVCTTDTHTLRKPPSDSGIHRLAVYVYEDNVLSSEMPACSLPFFLAPDSDAVASCNARREAIASYFNIFADDNMLLQMHLHEVMCNLRQSWITSPMFPPGCHGELKTDGSSAGSEKACRRRPVCPKKTDAWPDATRKQDTMTDSKPHQHGSTNKKRTDTTRPAVGAKRSIDELAGHVEGIYRSPELGLELPFTWKIHPDMQDNLLAQAFLNYVELTRELELVSGLQDRCEEHRRKKRQRCDKNHVVNMTSVK